MDAEAFLMRSIREAELQRTEALDAGSYVAARQSLRDVVELRAQLDALRADRKRQGSASQMSGEELEARLLEAARRMPPQHLVIFARLWFEQEGLAWPPA